MNAIVLSAGGLVMIALSLIGRATRPCDLDAPFLVVGLGLLVMAIARIAYLVGKDGQDDR